MDDVIIERVNRHLNSNTEISNKMRQIKLICIYKNRNNNNTTNYANINTNNKNKKYEINNVKDQ